MPIAITPIPVQVLTTTQLTADKMHIVNLTISDETKLKPRVRMTVLPYAEIDGEKHFAAESVTYETDDLYGAVANLHSEGLNAMAQAMAAVFAGAQELIQYITARKAEAATASEALTAAIASRDALRSTLMQKSADLMRIREAERLAIAVWQAAQGIASTDNATEEQIAEAEVKRVLKNTATSAAATAATALATDQSNYDVAHAGIQSLQTAVNALARAAADPANPRPVEG